MLRQDGGGEFIAVGIVIYNVERCVWTDSLVYNWEILVIGCHDYIVDGEKELLWSQREMGRGIEMR